MQKKEIFKIFTPVFTSANHKFLVNKCGLLTNKSHYVHIYMRLYRLILLT